MHSQLENYATVEIHPYWPYSRGARHETLRFPDRFYFTTKTQARNAKPFDVALNSFQQPSIQLITRFFCMVFRVVLASLTARFSGADRNYLSDRYQIVKVNGGVFASSRKLH